jgi:hypothetical protein
MKYYRLYAIYKMPNLRVLDFQKVGLKERIRAKNLFESEQGKEILENMTEKKFKEEDEGEFIKAVEVLIQDEKNKQKIYVRLSRLYLEFNSINKYVGRY